MLLVQRGISPKKSGLLPLLGSQGIAVKCTAGMFFRTYRKRLVLDQE